MRKNISRTTESLVLEKSILRALSPLQHARTTHTHTHSNGHPENSPSHRIHFLFYAFFGSVNNFLELQKQTLPVTFRARVVRFIVITLMNVSWMNVFAAFRTIFERFTVQKKMYIQQPSHSIRTYRAWYEGWVHIWIYTVTDKWISFGLRHFNVTNAYINGKKIWIVYEMGCYSIERHPTQCANYGNGCPMYYSFVAFEILKWEICLRIVAIKVCSHERFYCAPLLILNFLIYSFLPISNDAI